MWRSMEGRESQAGSWIVESWENNPSADRTECLAYKLWNIIFFWHHQHHQWWWWNQEIKLSLCLLICYCCPGSCWWTTPVCLVDIFTLGSFCSASLAHVTRGMGVACNGVLTEIGKGTSSPLLLSTSVWLYQLHQIARFFLLSQKDLCVCPLLWNR